MNAQTYISIALGVLGLGQLAALLGVWYRYAIPRAPVLFRILAVLPMLTSSTMAFVLTWMFLSGTKVVLGLGFLQIESIYFTAAATWTWTFVAYAVYFHLRGRHCPA